MPVAVETGVSYLRPRADELPDGDFVGRVVESADCGLLLDLHNVYCNSRNGRQPLDEYLDQLPLDRVWEMHLAGGMEMGGFWLDAHSGAIPDPLYAIAERLVPRLPNLKAIIFEIFPSFVPVVGLDLVREQVERLHALWALRAPARERSPAPVRLRLEDDARGAASPAAWERALGRLVIGRPADELHGPPAVAYALAARPCSSWSPWPHVPCLDNPSARGTICPSFIRPMPRSVSRRPRPCLRAAPKPPGSVRLLGV